jgi:hypothetical protein
MQFVPHRKRYISATKPNQVSESDAVYRENGTGHTNALFGQNAGFSMIKRVVHIVITGL